MKHFQEPAHCKAADIFTVELAVDDEEARTERVRWLEDADAYLEPFAKPARDDEGKPICFHCGSPIDSFKQALGIGAAIRWGLVHGEGTCTGMTDRPCGWPYRGMHHAKDRDGNPLFDLTNYFIPYHPDAVESADELKENTDALH